MNDSFVFYESWSNIIDSLDLNTAKDMLYQIYLVGMGRQLNTDNELVKGIIKGAIEPSIKSAKARYQNSIINGSKGGRPPKDLDINEILKLQSQGLTYEQIGKQLDVSKNTIADRIKKYKNQKPNNNENQKPKTNLNKDIDKDNDNENEKDKDINCFSF